ncbi:hypothetical protein ACFY00_37015 [Kitasatospora sp. NPDC001540]|uniref:hypothetical protein n=1 Tax=Kitasatospora sp. NPDC001540 TaxID=3364014 RepID=UPI00369D7B3A
MTRPLPTGTRAVRTACAGLAALAMTTGAAACSSNGGSGPSAAKAEVLTENGYRGLAPGMSKDAALAGGALETAAISLLGGCTDFTFAGSATARPSQDASRMAAEAAADAKLKELDAKADQVADATPTPLPSLRPNASAAESLEFARRAAESAQQAAADTRIIAEAAQAQADVMKLREDRDKAFLAQGRVSFGAAGLRELAVPAAVRTAAGIGAGSTLAELKQAYDSHGLALAANGRYRVPVDGKPGWAYEFTVDGEQVSGLALTDPDMKCA